ncbi:Cytosine/adenosine deaminase [Roseovarius azorensis]|uniref:Cytosine/adenosine deaminase n=1 Tax=Roseovarius azorensis TaxID=1287727 RepID=A0A1H7N224_9RHOB|nr:amidohydrolase family protein [Roseovarius azorensis]SEL17622.1 Cytosine/adenosine deaminase [Roseovarius azorensis]
MSAPHDLLLHCATIVTVDADRRVIDDGWIAVDNDRIAAIGTGQPPAARRVIDRPGLIALPGLIDAHCHSGHGLVRAAGDGDGDLWFRICEDIYAGAATPAFWLAEARLAQMERLLGGVTAAVSLLGGGADVMRTDAPEVGDAHCAATIESGLRTFIAVGPGRLPFPKAFGPDRRPVSFDQQMKVSADLISRHDAILTRRTGVALILPVYTQDHMDAHGAEIRRMSAAMRALQDRTGTLFTQDGHRSGSIALARDLGLLSPRAALGHSVDLTPEDFEALTETGASVIHNPSAIMSIIGRCPVPELIEAGVTVCLGSDAGAPDRGFDMFRHMAQAMHYHRRHFRDPAVLPDGKALELCTIDAARALGLDAELGSLETGKKADIVLLDGRKPHLWPPVMALNRITHFANAADVDTVIVDGQILMEGREILHLDLDEILADAAAEARKVFDISGHSQSRSEGADNWHQARRSTQPFRPAGSQG